MSFYVGIHKYIIFDYKSLYLYIRYTLLWQFLESFVITKLWDTIAPVSYTHLDVYKRQVHMYIIELY